MPLGQAASRWDAFGPQHQAVAFALGLQPADPLTQVLQGPLQRQRRIGGQQRRAVARIAEALGVAAPSLGHQLPGQAGGAIFGAMGQQVAPFVTALLLILLRRGAVVASAALVQDQHRASSPGGIDELGRCGFPAAPADEQAQWGRGLQAQDAGSLQPPPARGPGHIEAMLAGGQGQHRPQGLPAEAQAQPFAAARAVQLQRIGQRAAGMARLGIAAGQLHALEVEVGEMEGQQEQPQHQEAEQQGAIALQLDGHHLQQQQPRQPEPAEAGRHDVEIAQPEPQALAQLGLTEFHRPRPAVAGCAPPARLRTGRRRAGAHRPRPAPPARRRG